MNAELEKAIKTLIDKSEKAKQSDEAMRFAQAAQNLAHTQAVLNDTRRQNVVNTAL